MISDDLLRLSQKLKATVKWVAKTCNLFCNIAANGLERMLCILSPTNHSWLSLWKHPFLLALSSRGGTSATQRQKFHTDDVKSVRNPVRSADWSRETSPAAKSEEKRMFSQATPDLHAIYQFVASYLNDDWIKLSRSHSTRGTRGCDVTCCKTSLPWNGRTRSMYRFCCKK